MVQVRYTKALALAPAIFSAMTGIAAMAAVQQSADT